MSRTASAFANADGGEFFVGIDETGPAKTRSWRGFRDPEAANAHVQVLEACFPLGDAIDIELLSTERLPGLVMHVSVHKTRDIKKTSDGHVYLRRAAQNLPVATAIALRQLELNKGIVSFESETLPVPIETITNSKAITEFLREVVPTAEPAPFLTKQALIVGSKPTVAGVLLFADEPQASLPKRSAIKIYRYRTVDAPSRETLAGDPQTVEGNIYNQIQQAVQQTQTIVESVRVMSPVGLEDISYPPVALHEVLTNAVLHRDYAIADDVHIRVFDNRVEVESPGRLPGHVTEANILDERFARNGAIVRMINKFPNPPNKDVGEGLNTAFDAMRTARLKPPQIRQLPNSVLVAIRHERLASPEELVLAHLDAHPTITNGIARTLTNIGADYKIRAIFIRLEKAGQIERVPGRDRSRTQWRKKTPRKKPSAK